MADIFDEVDAALQRDKVVAWMKSRGHLVIVALIAIIVAVVMRNVWHDREEKTLKVQTAQLLEILLPVKSEVLKEEQADKILADLQKTGNKQIDVIAGLQRASRYEQAGDTTKALEVLESLAKRRYTEKVLQDLATVQYVRLKLSLVPDQDNLKTLLAQVKPLTEKDRAFRFSARELQGLILQLQNKNADAQKIFEALATDEAAPATLRERAQSYVIMMQSSQA